MTFPESSVCDTLFILDKYQLDMQSSPFPGGPVRLLDFFGYFYAPMPDDASANFMSVAQLAGFQCMLSQKDNTSSSGWLLKHAQKE